MGHGNTHFSKDGGWVAVLAAVMVD